MKIGVLETSSRKYMEHNLVGHIIRMRYPSLFRINSYVRLHKKSLNTVWMNQH